MTISGVFTALITPFRGDAVDYDGMRNNIRFQIEQGINGILPLGTTGEAPTISPEEKKNIIALAVEEGKGNVPVMVGTGSNDTATTIENTRLAKKLGADIALVVTPYYNKPTQDGIFQHLKAVNDAVDIPIVVYNIQSRTGTNIQTETMARLAELPNIIGVKEASGNINQIGDVIDTIVNRSKSFSVMSGDDGMTLPLLALGGHGVISVVSNLVPARIGAMINAALNNDLYQAAKIHFELLPLFKGAFIETNPIPIKAAMNMCGMAAGNCRLPLTPISAQAELKLKEILKEMKLI
jgi:4-hydroxy-tetrahydrodipicolinate synthase